MNLEEHLKRQIAFSKGAFGPGERRAGIIDHIRKELVEVEATDGPDPHEWVDVVILALDGLTRSLAAVYGSKTHKAHTDFIAKEAAGLIVAKQGLNEDRTWPDWRTAAPDRAIEHDRGQA